MHTYKMALAHTAVLVRITFSSVEAEVLITDTEVPFLRVLCHLDYLKERQDELYCTKITEDKKVTYFQSSIPILRQFSLHLEPKPCR